MAPGLAALDLLSLWFLMREPCLVPEAGSDLRRRARAPPPPGAIAQRGPRRWPPRRSRPAKEDRPKSPKTTHVERFQHQPETSR